MRSVLGLGRALNLPVLAEGVETVAELDFLSGELCNEAQGYLLGKPGDIEQFRRQTEGVDETAEEAEKALPPVSKASGM